MGWSDAACSGWKLKEKNSSASQGQELCEWGCAGELGEQDLGICIDPESRAGMGPRRGDPWSSVLTEAMEAQKGKDHS